MSQYPYRECHCGNQIHVGSTYLCKDCIRKLDQMKEEKMDVPMTQKFGIGRHRMRNGGIAEVTHRNKSGLFALVGAAQDNGGNWTVGNWSLEGSSVAGERLDLVAPIDEQPAGLAANHLAARAALAQPIQDLFPLLDEQPAKRITAAEVIKGWEAAFSGWTDITTALPGHHQVVIVQDEEGNVAVARMDVEILGGFDIAMHSDGGWFEFGTVKRWRVV